MPEKKEQPGEVKKLSEMLGEVQSDLVNTRLDSLKTRIEKKASVDDISTEQLPNTPEGIKNFEGFEWEIAHLISSLHIKSGLKKEELLLVFSSATFAKSIPKHLQAIYTKASAIYAAGVSNPVYNKIFSDWSSTVETMLIPHAATIIKMYGEESFMDMIPAQLKNSNMLSASLLGGGLYLGWTMISKLFGQSSEPFSLKSMLGYMLGGAAVGMIPAAGSTLSNTYSKVSEEVKEMVGISPAKTENKNIVTTPKVNVPTSTSSGTPSPESLGKKGKPLSELTKNESDAAANKVFGTGPGADLLIAVDNKYGGSGTLIKREIALGKHEGGLVFGRKNKDPKSGSNLGTFQIGGWNTTFEISEKKYNDCLTAGLQMYKKIFKKDLLASTLSIAHKDLISHIGYIESQRGGERTFKKLGDSSLTDAALVKLMSTTIQGGINAIGNDVVKMTKKPNININLA